MDAASPTATLLPAATKSAADELLLRRFRSSLRWCALDHSSPASRAASYLVFLVLAVALPAAVSILLPPPAATAGDLLINHLTQLPETILSAIAFLTLSTSFRRRGSLRQLLLLDGLLRDSHAVRRGYAREIDRAFRYLAAILLPSFSVELAQKALLLFDSPATAQPWRAVAAAAGVASWVYRNGVFLLVCVLFRLTCELQILRFEELYKMFGGGAAAETAEVEAVMFREHMRIKRQLQATSHRYRIFIVGCLVTITASQLGALLLVLVSKADKNFVNSGDLVACSVVQLSGFLMCLFGAARITHRAQRVVSVASRWHMIMSTSFSIIKFESNGGDESDGAGDFIGRDSFEPSISNMHSSFESRQALVAYLQHNGGGITIFGFALDRGLLHTLFAFEMTLVLWILSKVVVLS